MEKEAFRVNPELSAINFGELNRAVQAVGEGRRVDN